MTNGLVFVVSKHADLVYFFNHSGIPGFYCFDELLNVASAIILITYPGLRPTNIHVVEMKKEQHSCFRIRLDERH